MLLAWYVLEDEKWTWKSSFAEITTLDLTQFSTVSSVLERHIWKTIQQEGREADGTSV